MAKIQKLVCPECKTSFEFDPNSDDGVLVSLNAPATKLIKAGSRKKMSVVAYLECPNGHTKPYFVNKEY